MSYKLQFSYHLGKLELLKRWMQIILFQQCNKHIWPLESKWKFFLCELSLLQILSLSFQESNMVSALQCRFLICTLKFHFIYSYASYIHWLTKCILRPFDILSCSFVNKYSTFKIRIKALLFTFLFCFVFTSTQEMVQAITIPSSTVTGDIAQPLWTAVWRLIKKLTTHLPVDPAITIQENWKHVHKNPCTRMFNQICS